MEAIKRSSWTRMILGIGGVLVSAQTATAASVEVTYTSLEKMIVKRIMTEGGRYYLQGDPSDTCLYAFIQEPRVDGVGGRLRIVVLFAGRAGKQVAGRCVGPGDQFDLVISGRPTYADGELFLDELEIDAPDTVYFKLVAPLLRSHLERILRYRVEDGLAQGVAWVASTTGIGPLEVDSIDIDSIVVGESALRMRVDFRLSVGGEAKDRRAGSPR